MKKATQPTPKQLAEKVKSLEIIIKDLSATNTSLRQFNDSACKRICEMQESKLCVELEETRRRLEETQRKLIKAYDRIIDYNTIDQERLNRPVVNLKAV